VWTLLWTRKRLQSGLLCGLLCGHFIFDNYMNTYRLGSQLSNVCAGFAHDLRASNRINRMSRINRVGMKKALTGTGGNPQWGLGPTPQGVKKAQDFPLLMLALSFVFVWLMGEECFWKNSS